MAEETAVETTAETTSTEVQATPDEPLREGGLKALQAEREARKHAERLVKELEGKLAQSRTDEDLERVKQEVLTAANQRIIRADLKAAATGRLVNPELALKLIDLDQFGDEADESQLNQAVTDLLEQYPALAAEQSRFAGSADQGAAGREAEPPQLTETDLKTMSPKEIEAARKSGRLKSLMGGV